MFFSPSEIPKALIWQRIIRNFRKFADSCIGKCQQCMVANYRKFFPSWYLEFKTIFTSNLYKGLYYIKTCQLQFISQMMEFWIRTFNYLWNKIRLDLFFNNVLPYPDTKNRKWTILLWGKPVFTVLNITFYVTECILISNFQTYCVCIFRITSMEIRCTLLCQSFSFSFLQ